MSTPTRTQDAPFTGNKALADDTSTPPVPRDYSATTALEIRKELARRTPIVEAA